MKVYLNGSFIDENKAALSIHDRGFLYGDAIFETCRWHERGFFRFADHMRRLDAGAAALRLSVPPEDELLEIARTLARELGARDAAFRVTITRGTPAHSPTVLATVLPVPVGWAERAATGWSLITAHVCHPPVDPSASHVKAVGRLHGLLAHLEAQDANVDDALLLSPDGYVVEGPTWNIFWRRGRVLYTPSTETGILEGVTRATLLELAASLDYEVREGAFSRAELDLVDEIFVSMTSSGLVHVRSLDDRRFPPTAASAWQDLFTAYWRLVSEEAR
jgi:branched-subunit amino acid aminotransferase/4-amino-4-deoxychorismate lyase